MNIKCVFRVSLQLMSETFFILSRTERHVIRNIYWSSCKVPFIFVWLSLKWNFLYRFPTNIKFHENPFSGSGFVPCGETEGRTDMTKLIVAFCKFANAPENCGVPRITGKYSFDLDYPVGRFGVQTPVVARDFLFSTSVRTDPKSHPAYCTMGSRAFSGG
jgi:hypothetical protein